MSPARVVSVDILSDDDYSREALVVVPDDQLSLAIGREGQNVRLAHKLTGWKIDIKNVTQMQNAEIQQQQQQEYEAAEVAENADEDIEVVDEIKAEIEEELSEQVFEESEVAPELTVEAETEEAETAEEVE